MITLSPFWKVESHVPSSSGGILCSIFIWGEISQAHHSKVLSKLPCLFFSKIYTRSLWDICPRYCNNVLIDCSGVSSARAQRSPSLIRASLSVNWEKVFFAISRISRSIAISIRILRPSSMTIVSFSRKERRTSGLKRDHS